MMWLNGEILQVYWNGVHHVAAYLGNTLVWRENIRPVKATQDIEVTTPLATGTLRLSIPAESYQQLQLSIDKATANAGDSRSTIGFTDSSLRVSGDAYIRASRFPQGDVHFGTSIDLATVISALAKEALGVVAEGPEIVSDAASSPSVATTLDFAETIVSENNVASSRPVQPTTVQFVGGSKVNNASGVSKKPVLLSIDQAATTLGGTREGVSIKPLVLEASGDVSTQSVSSAVLIPSPLRLQSVYIEKIAYVATAEVKQEKTRAAMLVDGTLEEIIAEDFGTLTQIPAGVLGWMSNLKSVYIPDTITSIGEFFMGSYKGVISTVRMSPNVLNMHDNMFVTVYSGAKIEVLDCTAFTQVPVLSHLSNMETPWKNTIDQIKVPTSLVSTWQAANGWADYASKIVGG